MRVRSTWMILLAVVVLLSLPSPASGQAASTQATLNGTVLDEKGGGVPRAAITLKESETNATHSATTSDNGFYSIPNLPPGRYELKIAASGFANYTQTGLVLQVGQVATVDVT